MFITLNTSIKSLFTTGLISTRTYNALTNAGLVSVQSILEFIDFKSNKKIDFMPLCSIRNFGMKSYSEIKDIIGPFAKTCRDTDVAEDEIIPGLSLMVRPGVTLSDILNLHWDVINTVDNEVNEIINLNFSSSLSLYKFIYETDFTSLLEITGDTVEATISFRTIILEYLIDVVTDLKKSKIPGVKLILEKIDIVIKEISQDLEYVSLSKLNLLKATPTHVQSLQRKYKELAKKVLSVRAQRVIEDSLPNYKDILLCDRNEFNFFKNKVGRGQGKKTITDLIDFAEKFKKEFLTTIERTEYEIRINESEEKFPFLSSNQIDFVNSFKEQYGAYPCFYIAYNFIRLSDNTDFSAYSLLYGFFDQQQRSPKEVAKNLNLSYERIRQLVTNLHNRENLTCLKPEDWGSYDNITKATFLTENSYEYLEIKEKEKLCFDFHLFARILYIAFSYKVKEISDKIIAYNTSYVPHFKINRSIKVLEEIRTGKYSEDAFISINTTIDYLPIEEQEKAREIMIYVAKEVYGCKFSNNTTLVLKKNFLDLSKELYEIIQETGEPISLEDLFGVFKSKHPTHKFTDAQSIKPYLYKHPSVRSIGNSARYALVDWEHVFFGSIRAMVLDILDKSPEPVHIEFIFDKVLENFPSTTFRSVQSTCQSVAIPFNDGYYGLETKLYSKEFIERTFQRRFPFENRLRMFKEFIDTYHRFPTSTGGEHESSLHRWLYNIQHEILEITEEQGKELDEMLLSYENSGYPRTATENEFLQKCNDFKEYVNNNYKLPAYNAGEELFFWIRRSKGNFDSYTDQRRAYLTDLLNYLYSLGFCI